MCWFGRLVWMGIAESGDAHPACSTVSRLSRCMILVPVLLVIDLVAWMRGLASRHVCLPSRHSRVEGCHVPRRVGWY